MVFSFFNNVIVYLYYVSLYVLLLIIIVYIDIVRIIPTCRNSVILLLYPSLGLMCTSSLSHPRSHPSTVKMLWT
jgi:hypothetical protein